MKRQSVIALALLVLALTGSGLGAEDQKTMVIHAGRLFAGTSDALSSNQEIVIRGDRIADVGPAASVEVPAGAEEIDLRNATVLPGLIDGHAHMFKWKGLALEPGTFLKNSWQYRSCIELWA